jgi:SAM-dependent methyltransferase
LSGRERATVPARPARARATLLTRPSAPGVPTVLAPRTLADSHPVLAELLRPGLRVLDVGCGPGTLTAEIARRVRPGHVVGMDASAAMIAAAERAHPPAAEPNLVFYRGDLLTSTWSADFDLVSAARVLQWIRDPGTALRALARATRRAGRVVVLEVDHARTVWTGAPAPWRRFHRAFLEWRAASGLENGLARRLPALCREAGLGDVEIQRRAWTVRAGDRAFFRAVGAWRLMAETRGRQVVAASHLEEPERRAALEAFTDWMRGAGASQTLHETTVVASRATP